MRNGDGHAVGADSAGTPFGLLLSLSFAISGLGSWLGDGILRILIFEGPYGVKIITEGWGGRG